MDSTMPRVKEKYLNEVVPHLKEKLERANPMSLPKMIKLPQFQHTMTKQLWSFFLMIT